MKRGRPSGWQLNSRKMQRQEPPESVPTRWDRHLYRLGLLEEDVLKHGVSKDLERWIRANAYSCFIPESVLEMLAIETR